MSDLNDLLRRTERLQGHVEALRSELAELRKDLDLLQGSQSGNGGGPVPRETDSLAVALASAAELGASFCTALCSGNATGEAKP